MSSVKDVSLYSFPFSPPSCVHLAVSGNFSAPDVQEIVMVKGDYCLCLYRTNNGKLDLVSSTHVFGQIRSIIPLRLPEGDSDYLIAGSDSGRIAILQYSQQENKFIQIHMETFAKSGCRRTEPGEYLACDPRGRAVLIGAVERKKLVYVLAEDANKNMTISSPLEANYNNTSTLSICGMDTGWQNPVFAAVECDYSLATSDDPSPKQLTMYELDIGTNHVLRRPPVPLPDTAHCVISVPGHEDGPGGVLIACESRLVYKNIDTNTHIEVELPKRFSIDTLEKGALIVAHSLYIQRRRPTAAANEGRTLFFFLLQSELGDLFKCSFDYQDKTVNNISVSYFDTVPVANALCVLKSGFLFTASETANSEFFQFTGTGNDEPATNKSSAPASAPTLFAPRPYSNLLLVDELESLAPVTALKVADLGNENTPQYYFACGKGARSSLRVLRHGLAVAEMAASDLPKESNNVWAIKRAPGDPFMAYIVVGFSESTIVLSVGETVTEVTDSGLLLSAPSLLVLALADSSLIQVFPAGVRHIRPDQRVNEWKTPGIKAIECAAGNERQLAIALTGGEIIYFELDERTGHLVDIGRKEMGNDVACLDICAIDSATRRAPFLAVGVKDRVVRLLSLSPNSPLDQVSFQAVDEVPSGVLLATFENAQTSPELYLFTGRADGVLVRTRVDPTTGALSDTRRRVVGHDGVRLVRTRTEGRDSVLALTSSRTWLAYSHNERIHLNPLSYEAADYASSFSSPQCPEGLVFICANTLRIIAVERLGEQFNSIAMPLRYTPRQMAISRTNMLVIVEADTNSYTDHKKSILKKALLESGRRDGIIGDGYTPPHESITGAPQAGEGNWGSCIRVVDPNRLETVSLTELEDNEAALSLAVFTDGRDHYVAVGVAKNYRQNPRSFDSCSILIYRIGQHHELKLLHRTPVNDLVLALEPFQDGKYLLAGVGNTLRLYSLGKNRLLRTSENRNFPTTIRSIHVRAQRIVVGDLCEGFHFVLYRPATNELEIIGDGTCPRYLTASCMVDYNTVCGADKFGNIFVSRIPSNLTDSALQAAAAAQGAGQRINKFLQGAPIKLTDIANYHVGSIVTGLQMAVLRPGGEEVIVYTTITGAVGVLSPLMSRDESDLMSRFELAMRRNKPPICGRDHMAFRSAYFPVKNVIDGELCEMFDDLSGASQADLAQSLGLEPVDLTRKMEELRNRVI